jgi:hypothetical protein
MNGYMTSWRFTAMLDHGHHLSIPSIDTLTTTATTNPEMFVGPPSPSNVSIETKRNTTHMIILEGADGSGKSTLAKKISDLLGWRLQHSGGPPKSELEMIRRVNTYLTGERNVVYDRFPTITDPIYARAFGRSTPITSEMRWALTRLEPMIVFCHAPSAYLGDQTNHEIDTISHVEAVRKNHLRLREQYLAYFDRVPPAITFHWQNEEDVLLAAQLYSEKTS